MFVVKAKTMEKTLLDLLPDALDKVFPKRFEAIIVMCIVVLMAFVLMEIIYKVTFFVCRRMASRRHYGFLLYIIKGKRLRRLAYIVPPIFVEIMLPFVFVKESTLLHYLENATWIWFTVCVVINMNTLLITIGESAFTNSKYHDRPIKGFLQITRITVFIIATIIIVSILTDKSPVYLIGGLGAFAALLMLIAKDSIMGFVGGFLLLENDMVRLGDWIEIPGTGINGTVSDISLTIVKVRNWDNTIATIPPYTLINQSFINWRGMSESGGRRIARGYTVKLDCIKPCNRRMLQRVMSLDKDFGERIKSMDAQTWDTNASLFRDYALMYLNRHPMIRKDMIVMVRTLEPTGNGLPIQFYCFTTTTEWCEYENIQSAIMEHFASVLPVFELYPFQASGARDTIISGLIEGQFPVERINGMPTDTIK